MFKANLIPKLLILLIFVSCSQSSDNEPTNTIRIVDNIPEEFIDYTIEDINLNFNKTEIITNQNSVSFSISSNLSFSKIQIYKDSLCQELLLEEIYLQNKNIIVSGYKLNDKSKFYYKIKLNNDLSECNESPIVVNHDNISPDAPIISEYINNNFNGQIVGNNIIKIGGETSDLSLDTSSIIILIKNQSNEIIKTKEFSLNDYLSKNIILEILSNEYTLLNLKSKDYHGNISDLNPISVIIEHDQSAGVVNKPVLNQRIKDLYNRYTSSLIFNFKGFLDYNSLYINIYSDSNKNNLIKQISKNSFETNGLEVSLTPNSLNQFWLSASNDSVESDLLEFKINHNDSTPQPPILDQSILDVHNGIIDIINAQIFGTIPPTIDFVYIYNNPELSGDPIYTISRQDFNNNTGLPLALDFGNNYLYFVAIDFNNLKSDYVYIQVFVEE